MRRAFIGSILDRATDEEGAYWAPSGSGFPGSLGRMKGQPFMLRTMAPWVPSFRAINAQNRSRFCARLRGMNVRFMPAIMTPMPPAFCVGPT